MKKFLAAFAGLAMAASAVNAAIFTVDLDDVFSVDEIGDLDNMIATITTGIANGHVVSIGWDVEIFADSPSWLSEASVAFGGTNAFNTVNYPLSLTPGISDSFPGTGIYSSGGLVDLVGLGYDFSLDGDGLLWLEFFEGYDDFPDDWDAIWSGQLQIEVLDVPAPSAFALLGFAGIVAGRRRR